MGKMNYEMFKNIVDEAEGNVQFLSLASRGEPLLCPDIDKMLDQGVIPHDLKPQNILVDFDDKGNLLDLVITDFDDKWYNKIIDNELEKETYEFIENNKRIFQLWLILLYSDYEMNELVKLIKTKEFHMIFLLIVFIYRSIILINRERLAQNIGFI